jgi:molybdate transport system substrate-binding protein
MTGAVPCLLSLGVEPSGSTALANIQVLTGGAPKEVLTLLTPDFEKKTGHKLHCTYVVISAIQQKLAAGENPDVVLMPAPALEAQVKAGVMRDAPRPNLGIVRVGMVVREGAPKPDISTLEKFKQAVRAAKTLVHSNPAATPSGAHLGKMWDQLGMTDAIKAKVTHRSALDGGVDAIKNGEVEVGFYPVSEIISVKGVSLAGLIPDEVQLDTVYAAGVLTANAAPDAAIAFVNFLADPAHAKNWKHAGFEPPNAK